MKRALTQKVWMLIGLLVLTALLVLISVLLARMRPDPGAPIYWQGHEINFTNQTSRGGLR